MLVICCILSLKMTFFLLRFLPFALSLSSIKIIYMSVRVCCICVHSDQLYCQLRNDVIYGFC
jgi:hypothetical protein